MSSSTPDFRPVPPSSDYPAVQEYLFSLKAQGIRFGIDRMRMLVAALGHPERAVPMVHFAGTNGKGSTAALLDAILHAAGRRTGMYTSPHLVKLGERVQVDRRILSEEEIVAYTRELGPIAETIAAASPDDRPSFFEFMTAMAFLQFARSQCEVGLVEVGLGGRLDATNVVMPEVSVITSIGLDHCEMLGDSLELIAREKAGIIKPGRPVVIGRMPTEAEREIRQIASRLGAPLHSVRDVYGEDINRYPETNLEGDYQRWNAATATLVARTLPREWGVDDAAISRGLTHADWPGRWQRTMLGGRLLVLDASHNPEGAEVLSTNLERLVAETGRAPVIIVGVLGTARALPLMEVIARHARAIHLVVPHQPRACSHEQLEALIPSTFGGAVVRGSVDGLFPDPRTCTAGNDDDVIVVTGSIYLLGEVMARLEPERGAIESRLQDF